ncbi:hypothetical protein BX666DRAFT_1890358 [Dichotomocladium elegans]|nr:hypothetical protein BX666DRAFT_1890358 [Dichotomocladium elegans]
MYISKTQSNFPPMILEFQAEVDLDYIHRAFSYCMEIYKRYTIFPVVLMCSSSYRDGSLSTDDQDITRITITIKTASATTILCTTLTFPVR